MDSLPRSKKDAEDDVETILAAIEAAGYVPGKDVFIGFDCASSNSTIKNVRVYDH